MGLFEEERRMIETLKKEAYEAIEKAVNFAK